MVSDSTDFSKNAPHSKLEMVFTKENSGSSLAIVILGAGRRKGAVETSPEYQQEDLLHNSIERLRYGTRLSKQTKLPALVRDSAPDEVSKEELSEAFMMRLVLEQELGLSPK